MDLKRSIPIQNYNRLFFPLFFPLSFLFLSLYILMSLSILTSSWLVSPSPAPSSPSGPKPTCVVS